MSTFLDAHLDINGVRQSALWLFTNWGRTIVSFGTIIYHRLHTGTECYAEVVQFCARSSSEVLFQTRLLGWQTSEGWKTPTFDVLAYVIVPLARCHPKFSGRGWSYFIYDGPLQRLAHDALHYVKMHLSDHPLTRLVPGDHITGWMINGFMHSPVLRAFETHLSNGMTVAHDDVDLPLKADIIQPPPNFNTSQNTVSRFSAGMQLRLNLTRADTTSRPPHLLVICRLQCPIEEQTTTVRPHIA